VLRAYFNYPTSRVTVHRDPTCPFFRRGDNPPGRKCLLNARTISTELGKFERGEYKFTSQAGYNDIWLEVVFQDDEYELALAKHIHKLLARGYKRFRDAQMRIHCEPLSPYGRKGNDKMETPTVVAAVEKIRAKFEETGSPARIPKIRDGYFTGTLRPEGVEVDNLGKHPFLPWAVFQETICLLIRKGGRAIKGRAMSGKLGDPDLPLDSVEGHVAHVVYGKRLGDSAFRKITPIGCILIWAGVCKNARGVLLLRGVD